MKYLVIIPFLVISVLSQGQINSTRYTWSENPVLDTSTVDTSMQAVNLQTKLMKELVYEQGELFEYLLLHKRVKVLTSKGLKRFNTVFIPQYYNSTVIKEKGRVIKKGGTVVDLNPEDIKEGVDEDTERKYRYFAFEDLEIGNEIEYMYLIKKKPYHYGLKYNAQSAYPSYNYSFDLYAPSNLLYKFNTYNGFPEVKLDTNYKEANYWHVELDSIERLKEERMANYENDLQAFSFKLHKNYATGASDITSYGPWAKNVHEFIYAEDKKKKAVIKKIIKACNPPKDNEEKAIRAVEDYLKKNYTYYNSEIAELSDIPQIFKNKAYNSDGAMKIFANILQALDIKHELVVTSDRWDLKFDKDFESYMFLKDFLFYFPKLDKYLSADNSFSRLGFPSQENTNNYGLFIKEVKMGDFKSAIGKVKYIKSSPMKDTENNIKVDVSFEDDFLKAKLLTTQKLTGYDAVYVQPAFDLIDDEEDLKEFKEQIVNVFDIDEKPTSYTFENTLGSDFGNKPLIINSEYNTEHLTEKAGETYLFKLGRLIGPQMELYKNDEERKEKIEFFYNRTYHRELNIRIPEGYEVNNLDKLIFEKTYLAENGDTLFAFISSYTVEDSILKIKIEEWYDGIEYGPEVWDNYREVVNAAANFNKAIIFFTPKKP